LSATSTSRYDATGARSPQWWPSRYGAGDTIGAGNELTAERTLEALKLPRQGRVLELAQLLGPESPAFPPRTFNQLVLAHQTLNPFGPGAADLVGFEEHVTQSYHIGCHIDGLGHVGIAGHFYNGVHHTDFYSPTGLTTYGAETIKPWICRGVCLDVAGLVGTAVLPEGFVVTVDHLEQACAAQGVEVRAGDVVLLHTGWGSKWMTDASYGSGEPGAGWDAAHWLTERRVSLVGADNYAFEVIPFEKEEWPFVIHQHLLAETGTFIIENIKTQELVDAGASEFLFCTSVPKTKGATGGIVSPVAVL
jgi:kynurenine formamidase